MKTAGGLAAYGVLPICAYGNAKERHITKLHKQLAEALSAQRPPTEIENILQKIPALHSSYHDCLPLLLAKYGNGADNENELMKMELELWPIVKMMLERGTLANAKRKDYTALSCALRRGHLQIAKLLLDAGADKNEAFVNDVFKDYNLNYRDKTIELLLDHGADVNTPCGFIRRTTALHIAAARGDFRLMQLLFEYGAITSLNKRNDNSETPLFLAAKEGHADCMRFLLKYGADITASDTNGNSIETIASLSHAQAYAPAQDKPLTILDEYRRETHFAARHGLTDAEAKKFASKSATEQRKIKNEGFFEPGLATSGLNSIVADYIAGSDSDATLLAAQGITEMLNNQENDQQAQAETRWLGLGGTPMQVKARQLNHNYT